MSELTQRERAAGEREYLVSETVKVHGTVVVSARSQREAIEKVRSAFGTDEAYEFNYEPGDTGRLRAIRLGRP